MTEPTTAPFGSWSSPITASMLSSAGIGLSEVWLEDGAAYWLETRPSEQGRGVVMRGDPWSSPTEVTPEGFNVRTTVHEYGGGAFAVHRGTVVFSHRVDQRLYRLGANDTTPVPITPDTSGTHRYADGRITADGRRWIGVRERHEGAGAPAEVVNELVVLPLDGGAPRGRSPRAGTSIRIPASRPTARSSRSWPGTCHGCPGTAVSCSSATSARTARCRTFASWPAPTATESIWAPDWSPAGVLHFASDRTGWWNLERIVDGERQALCPMEAEFGFPHWVFGSRSYGFLEDGRIACWYERGGTQMLAVLDPETGELLDLDLPHTALHWGPAMAVEGSQIAFVAGAPDRPEELVWLDFTRAIRRGPACQRGGAVRSGVRVGAVPIEFPTDGGVTAFAHVYYPPRTRTSPALPGERPPLIVMSHGGPTGRGHRRVRPARCSSGPAAGSPWST